MTTEVLRQAKPSDPFHAGLASGWRVIDASTLTQDRSFEADVAIVGTGAGGGTAAEILTEAGLSVVMIEEGPLATSSDFHMREAEAYPQLYQESAARKTKDKAINILLPVHSQDPRALTPKEFVKKLARIAPPKPPMRRTAIATQMFGAKARAT